MIKDVNIYEGEASINNDAWTTEQDVMESSTLMQYIGLKDKNRVEIYEGDILQSNTQPITAIVVWETPCFSLQAANGQMGDFIVSESYRNGKPCGYIEVIGNIYENGDLLNVITN